MSKNTKTVLVSGATGLVGSALCRDLESKGHTVRRLSRGKEGDVRWDIDSGKIDTNAMDGVDTVVHLAGETVAQRWTNATKARIIHSRVEGAKLLVRLILQQQNPPDYISASGVNFYGYQCGVGVTETSLAGDGFLAEVCRQWESAAKPLNDVGIRTVFARIGLILSAQGGALPRMLPLFKLGVGGRIGSGKQHMSWVSLFDLVRILSLAIEDVALTGPLNAVSPQPVTNSEFTALLGGLLKRPTLFPVPTMMVKMFFGKMGQETLCSDIGALPKRLNDTGFEWDYADLRSCLSACIRGQF